MNKYKCLFECTEIGNLKIKNKFSMAPMGPFGFAGENGTFNQKGAEYYIERAKGNTGLIITGLCSVENEIEEIIRPSIPCPTMNPAAFIMSTKEMVERIHAYDSKIFLQLTGGFGRAGLPNIIKKAVAPCDIENRWDPSLKHRELTVQEIQNYVKKFAEAAFIAKNAGFDGIEIHAVHEGYLIDQFTIGLYNNRTDEYGGDIRGRLKFPIDIVKAVKRICGEDFPVSLRYSLKSFVKGIRQGALPGEDFKELGRDTEEGIEAAKILVEAGYDALNVDSGTYDSWYWNHPPMYFDKNGIYLPFARILKRSLDVPIIAAGRMDDPDVALKAVQEGYCDIIGLGRPLLADPYLPSKVKRGKIEKIRPCLSCHEGCMGRLAKGGSLSCAVNPACGREKNYGISPASTKKKVLVIGGGIAGMEASRVCAMRGHEVHLYEKSHELGGHVIAGSIPSFKNNDYKLLKWYEGELEDLGVNIHFGVEADLNLVRNEKADVVIVSTGSTPVNLDLPGMKKNNVLTADEALLDFSRIGSDVAIVGAGLVGSETALWLKQNGKNVTLIESSEKILGGGHDMPFMNYDMLKDMLNYNKVDIMTSSLVKEINGQGGVVNTKDGDKSFEADTIILSVGYKSNNTLYHELCDVVDDIYVLGDAKNVKNIMYAIWDAYEVSRNI
ncbi:MAG: FAD-dependent oxidoreductase [Clostridium sp.]|jgi:2-enoate reductase|uniref:oxidoreductase n=1 Tax=Clostridium sp. TaxID=1506 RepID=UPI0025C5C1C8|nr:FAD-dependent oxidoreductase [Clostridium sp.]MCH3963527.1 FAD-dependent oxidoreductase [Clostridium sp.]MCI1714668.1 FAD-dependent oxidoreductase [Clostridium sp.]MCI1799143.1 FAD-dependent oxidoreductase [Clostridium sp.]MCI1812851.1 FAD-dependent oxidoreductase [Clostridium sp.]MCI1869741.1 FAD-dependent oxidoreductase [Clostridium sp.]